MAVSEPVSVQVIKDAQGTSEHIDCFHCRERPVHLRKVLLRIFHQDVGKGDAAKLIAAHFEQADKMRMREERGGLPSCELGLSCYVIDKNKLDRRSLWFTLGPFCQENGAALAAPEISEKPKGTAYDMALPLAPRPNRLHARTHSLSIIHSCYLAEKRPCRTLSLRLVKYCFAVAAGNACNNPKRKK